MSDTALNKYVAQGDDAAEAAFTPNPVTGTTPEQAVLFVNDEDPVNPALKWWDGANFVSVGGGGSGTVTNTGTLTSGTLIQGNGTVDVTVNATTATVTKLTSGVPSAATAGLDYVSPTYLPAVCTGRLTTESGVPVSTSDRTAQGTIYFTPCTTGGDATTIGAITLYSGSALVMFTFTELSLVLSVTSGKNYDVFVDYNSGTPQLVLSAAWTTATARADALATQSGIIVKSGTATYRWIGTIRASGANVTEDSATKRFVWNAVNQTPRTLAVTDSTASWNYNVASWRQARATATNQVEWVVGGTTTMIDLTLVARLQVSNCAARVGIGVDSTTAPSGSWAEKFDNGIDGQGHTATYVGLSSLGYHYSAWLEYGDAGNPTFFGTATSAQSYLSGTILN